ncbi:MAG: hypothetical protein RDV41_03140 [Planctomycetota bacterium]|nr:hypothetical protein [Planctomycetota bacterium]
MVENIAVVAVAVFLVLYGTRDLVKLLSLQKRRRIIRATPTTPVGKVEKGFVELKGQALPIKSDLLLTSPISGAKCLFWRYEIQRQRYSGRTGLVWETIKEDQLGESFVMRDNSGAAVINLHEVEIDLVRDRTEHISPGQVLLPEVQRFFRVVGFDFASGPTKGPAADAAPAQSGDAGKPAPSTGKPPLAFAPDGHCPGPSLASLEAGRACRTESQGLVRVIESYLLPGDGIYVHGYASPTEPEVLLEDATKARVTIAANPESPAFFISDKTEPMLLHELEEESRVLFLWLVGLFGLAALLLAVVISGRQR